ncbi:hypothetical protein [Rudaea sp.]|uniref:hypothetical protein n=1 Tax=Rudaea sp. TaxID=2136325 RepID=UPI002ED4B22C
MTHQVWMHPQDQAVRAQRVRISRRPTKAHWLGLFLFRLFRILNHRANESLIFGIFVVTKTPVMTTSYSDMCTTDSKDSIAPQPPFEPAQILRGFPDGQAELAAYWLQTVLEDRADSAAPPPASTEAEL